LWHCFNAYFGHKKVIFLEKSPGLTDQRLIEQPTIQEQYLFALLEIIIKINSAREEKGTTLEREEMKKLFAK
jgi:hypothetical protein